MERKFIYYSELYLGESINAKKLDKIKKKLERKPLFANVHLITLAHNPSDQLEIFDSKQLVQRYYEGYIPYVIGIAADYEEAVALLEQIVKECLQERGDCNLKEYLLC